MDEYFRQALREVVASLMKKAKLPRSPKSIDPYEDEELLAILDVQRAVEAGCRTPDEVIEFLHIGDEGWFFENRVRNKAEIKMLEATWNKVLEKEGMPERLKSIPSSGIDVDRVFVEQPRLADLDDSLPLPNVFSQREREVLEMHLRGMSLKEISRILGISKGATQEYLRRALHKLRCLSR